MRATALLTDEVRRFVFQGSLSRRECTHLRDVPTTTSAGGCRDCEASTLTWVHLRICVTCGVVGCCDSSAGRHARRHFNETGHPAIRSIEPGEAWAWCYVDRVYMSARQRGKD
jgi:monovalent cation/hydrogen antiporter